MKISTLMTINLVLVLSLCFTGVLLAQEKKVMDVALISLAVTDVKLTHSVEGEPSKNWAVKVFIRNQGTEVLRNVGVCLTAWCGKSGTVPPDKRFLRRRRQYLTQQKRVQLLKPNQSRAVVFHVLTPKGTKTILFGALADCGKLSKTVTAAQAKAGKVAGLIDEGEKEGNNYKEQQAKH